MRYSYSTKLDVLKVWSGYEAEHDQILKDKYNEYDWHGEIDPKRKVAYEYGCFRKPDEEPPERLANYIKGLKFKYSEE